VNRIASKQFMLRSLRFLSVKIPARAMFIVVNYNKTTLGAPTAALSQILKLET
jgi:hypothetical protein